MDFFEHQEKAKRNSLRLLLLFALALLSIFSALYVLATWVHLGGLHIAPTEQGSGGWMDPGRLGVTAAFTLILVGGGSLLRMGQLRSGGRAVAESLDGTRLVLQPGDLAAQRLQNVVEELAIAAGCAVPEIYVLEQESGINAFAAGLGPGDAVIGVTRGAIEQLSRDELRGVIGHEFSHILNGDMRLNLRLIGLLYGILCLALFGRALLNSGRSHLVGRRRRGGEVELVIALGLVAVGSIGVFFGRLIQAAVSRQRELLADASAAQFTRDPEALAQALEKIGRHGSQLKHSQSAQVAHMLLGAHRKGGTGRSWFATHPPIAERVARLRSRPLETRATEVWQQIGAAMSARDPLERGAAAAAPGAAFAAPRSKSSTRRRDGAATPAAIDWKRLFPREQPNVAHAASVHPAAAPTRSLDNEVAELGALAGTMTAQARSHSTGLLESLPPRLAQAAHNPLGARAIALGLMLGPKGPGRDQRRASLLHGGHALLAAELGRLEPRLSALEERLALPLFDLCLPAIKAGSARQYQELRGLLFELSASDGWLDPLELALRAILVARLDSHFAVKPAKPRAVRRLSAVPDAVQVVCGVFAHYGGDSSEEREAVYQACLSGLHLESSGPLLPILELLPRLEPALEELADVLPLEQRDLLAALLQLVHRDGQTSVREAECLRAVAERLACPLSPVLTALEAANG
jgi:Zn-dependent protease with chaperone function